MSNTFITPTSVAKIALITLLNNLCFVGLVHRDYDKEFHKVGDTVRIRKPATLNAIEFDGDLSGEWQPVTESYVDVKMNKILTVPVEITAKELSLDVVSFQTQVIQPAVEALAQKMDENLAQLYYDIPYYEDCESTTAISDLLNARKLQNNNKVPFNASRYAVMSPLTTASLLALDAFRDLDKTGSTKALREASLGRLFGYEFFENQNIKTHTNGSVSTADKITCTKTGDVLNIEAVTDTCTVMHGDIIKASDGQEFVILEDSGDITAGNDKDLSHWPAITADVSQETITAVHSDGAGSKTNLMFHRNAFSLVTAPLAPPIGGAKGVTVNYKGLAINVVYDYEHGKFQNSATFSILCGFKTLTPELAVRLYDAS